LNACHRRSWLKIISAENCRREQDIDDGAQAQSKYDLAGYAPFGRYVANQFIAESVIEGAFDGYNSRRGKNSLAIFRLA